LAGLSTNSGQLKKRCSPLNNRNLQLKVNLMKKIYTCENNLSMNHIKNVLENNGIGCLIRNESLGSTAGELPPIVAWPELWLKDLSQESAALKLIHEITTGPPEVNVDWECEQCGEQIEGQFQLCWNCGGAVEFTA